MEINLLAPDTTKEWTYEDLQLFDEDFYCEILNGELYMSPSPSKKHQYVLGKIYTLFENFVERNSLGEIFFAPLDVKLDTKNVVQPDLIFISTGNTNYKNTTETIIIGAPDLVLEIVSPYSVRRDYYTKLKTYEKYSIKEYWIVDPANEVVEVFSLTDQNEYELFSNMVKKGNIESKILKGFQLNLDIIF